MIAPVPSRRLTPGGEPDVQEDLDQHRGRRRPVGLAGVAWPWASRARCQRRSATSSKPDASAVMTGPQGEAGSTCPRPSRTSPTRRASAWAKVYDRVESGEMPPKARERPTLDESRILLGWLGRSLTDAEDARLAASGRSALRRLTRAEYENTVRDLLDLPGAALSALLPPDGSAHGFDKNAEALSLSHVNLAKYIEAADHALNLAIATRPTPPAVRNSRLSLVDRGGFDAYLSMQGDAVLLRDMKPDPEFPPAGEQRHYDQGAHEGDGLVRDREQRRRLPA